MAIDKYQSQKHKIEIFVSEEFWRTKRVVYNTLVRQNSKILSTNGKVACGA